MLKYVLAIDDSTKNSIRPKKEKEKKENIEPQIMSNLCELIHQVLNLSFILAMKC